MSEAVPRALHGWGRYPRVAAEVAWPATATACVRLLQRDAVTTVVGEGLAAPPWIARGLGRGYGDCALGPRVLQLTRMDQLLDFDEACGVLSCAAGASLDDILQVFVPRGWFLPVTPGTRFVTVGGAIAADVHGKNHHHDGTFGQHIEWIDLLLGSGDCVRTSPEQHPDLFAATCGGMGLTGVILRAAIRLRPIRSAQIDEITLRLPSLDALIEAFEAHVGTTYSVAWIDCQARGRSLGRGLLMLGEHAHEGALDAPGAPRLNVPVDAPSALLHGANVRAFNALYYAKSWRRVHRRRVHLGPFFYPLDAIGQWNRLYGRVGFVQYQCVLPRQASARGLREMLMRIADAGQGSFLAVLKRLGAANDHPLSFPMEGHTLALDFKVQDKLWPLLDTLDRIVLDHGGRLYLAKDARMSEALFQSGYPRWREFEAVRQRWHASGRFGSAQSRRLGLS